MIITWPDFVWGHNKGEGGGKLRNTPQTLLGPEMIGIIETFEGQRGQSSTELFRTNSQVTMGTN